MIPTTETGHLRFREKTYSQVRSQLCFLFYGHTRSTLTRKATCAHTFEKVQWKNKVFTGPPEPLSPHPAPSKVRYNDSKRRHSLMVVGLLVISIAKTVQQKEIFPPSDWWRFNRTDASLGPTNLTRRKNDKIQEMCPLAFFSSCNEEANGRSHKTALRQIAIVSRNCGDRKWSN